ncbi:MAG: hypothetical protein FJ004_11555, partial [Chloroflexi bacterium]|nr:hypothetical protein [Chloroflexota bacterium]
MGKFPIPRYRYGLIPIRYTPLFAPYSITVNLYRYLSDRYPTMLYDLLETGSIKLEKDDILLGHPNRDPSTIVQQTFRNGYNSKCKALIFPLHHGIPAINEYAIPLIDQADIVFGIMGQYWYDTIDTSFLAPWKHKIVRLDMAIDTIEYPLVKHHFNPPGRRGYLYIGSNRPEKGCSILARTMAELNDY